MQDSSVPDMLEKGESMSKLSQEEVQSLRSRIYHGEQELISSLTPEQFFALLSHDYDTGFTAGKTSAQKEALCMLAADGMPVEKIALLLQIKAETVREIMAAKQAHIEKCRKKLEQAVNRRRVSGRATKENRQTEIDYSRTDCAKQGDHS